MIDQSNFGCRAIVVVFQPTIRLNLSVTYCFFDLVLFLTDDLDESVSSDILLFDLEIIICIIEVNVGDWFPCMVR